MYTINLNLDQMIICFLLILIWTLIIAFYYYHKGINDSHHSPRG